MRVELQNVKKTYNGREVLDVGSLQLESGKIYAVLGPNGSGKTTMLRIIAGIESATSGMIGFGGSNREDIAYMPQKSYMFDFTVLDNVILGIQKTANSAQNAKKLAFKALESLGMGMFAEMKARQLSGGEAQRVALARTLAAGKALVLLDEPASATDISGMELVEAYIRDIRREFGSSIVFTTHNPSQAARLADEVIIMHGGRIMETGSPGEVFHSPKSQETRDFLKSWRF